MYKMTKKFQNSKNLKWLKQKKLNTNKMNGKTESNISYINIMNKVELKKNFQKIN